MEEANRFGSYALGRAEKPTYKVGQDVLVLVSYGNTGVADVREMEVKAVSANGHAVKVGLGELIKPFWVEVGRIVDSVG